VKNRHANTNVLCFMLYKLKTFCGLWRSLLQSGSAVQVLLQPHIFISVSGIFTSIYLSFIYKWVNLFAIFRNWRTEGQIIGEWTSESRKVPAGHMDMINFCNNMLTVWQNNWQWNIFMNVEKLRASEQRNSILSLYQD
jgi:hypothetical protein